MTRSRTSERRADTHVSRLENLLDLLEMFYGALPAPPRDPFILFVWEVLSVRSTPRKRDAALAALKRIRALTPDAMWRAAHAKLEASVALAGPYAEQRLRALRTGVDLFRRSPDLPAVIKGPLPAARRALKPLPQLGEAGAHRMLLFAADHPILPVDALVGRVGLRLGYGEPSDDFRKAARTVQNALTRELPPAVDAFRRAFEYLSHHGGALLSEDACRELLRRHAGDEALFESHLLRHATKPQILARMLLNLKRVYVRMHSFPQARDITELLLAVDPSAINELRDRGLLAYHLKDFSAALRDLQTYLQLSSSNPLDEEERAEQAQIWEHVKTLRKRVASLN